MIAVSEILDNLCYMMRNHFRGVEIIIATEMRL
jgi:hypothetical protein